MPGGALDLPGAPNQNEKKSGQVGFCAPAADTGDASQALEGELRSEYIGRLARSIYEARVLSAQVGEDEQYAEWRKGRAAYGASAAEVLEAEPVVDMWWERWQERSEPRAMCAELQAQAQEFIAKKAEQVVTPAYWNK